MYSIYEYIMYIMSEYTFIVVIYIYIYIYTRRSYNKFPDFFRMGTFIESTHMKL